MIDALISGLARGVSHLTDADVHPGETLCE